MRLIDDDALENILSSAIETMRKIAKILDEEDDPEIRMEIKSYTDILNGVKQQPTIEPDRKKGKWVESDTDGFVCSVCRNGYRCQPTLMGKPMFEYCPVCGVKMESET